MEIHYYNGAFSAARLSGLLDVLSEYAIVALQGVHSKILPPRNAISIERGPGHFDDNIRSVPNPTPPLQP